MQITAEKRNVNAMGMQAQRQFTVKVGAHIMQVLSGLYREPEKAMVREYLTNMYDAWIALKRANPAAVYRPAELHLPTALSPYLVFKDFGIGMSYEQIWNTYATYGDSTKNGNNDEVGGFGLGSKTAFCYNNGQQWTIESRYNGEHMTFMAFVGEDGIPNLVHVSTTPTTEQNGVTVKIPIKREHINSVQEAAQLYVPYYPMELNVLNATKPIERVSYLMDEPTKWGIRASAEPTSPYRYNRHMPQPSYVVMGNVPYPIERNAIDLTSELGSIWRDYWNVGVDLYVSIGSVDIVPSRDGLKYTDRTKDAIRASARALVKGLNAKVSGMLNQAPTLYEAYKVFYEKVNVMQSVKEMVTKPNWRGIELSTLFGLRADENRLHAIDKNATIQYLHTTTDRVTPEAQTSYGHFPGRSTHIVMLDDTGKGALVIAKGWCYTNLAHRDPVSKRITKRGHKAGSVTLVTGKITRKDVAALFGDMPENEVLLASEVSGKVVIPKGLTTIDSLYRFDGGKVWAARVNVPKDGPYYYVRLTQDPHTKRWTSPDLHNPESVRQLLSVAKQLGIAVESLYGIKENEIKNFDAKKWIDLGTLVYEKAEKFLADNEQRIAKYLWRSDLSNIETVYKLLSDKTIVTNARDAKIVEFVTQMDDMIAARSDQNIHNVVSRLNTINRAANRAAPLMRLSVDTFKLKDTPDPLFKHIDKTYPMLMLYIARGGGYYYGYELDKSKAKIVVDYLNLVHDNKGK